jgi:hypothetical protein
MSCVAVATDDERRGNAAALQSTAAGRAPGAETVACAHAGLPGKRRSRIGACAVAACAGLGSAGTPAWWWQEDGDEQKGGGDGAAGACRDVGLDAPAGMQSSVREGGDGACALTPGADPS